MPRLRIFIFSYNRGIFLDNCVNSALKCAPHSEIFIVDDWSSDRLTQGVLQRLSLSEQVNLLRPKNDSTAKHGGLYANMELAFTCCGKGDIALFLQDDMQFVRPILDRDIEDIQSYFVHSDKRAFLYPGFLKLANYSGLSMKLAPGNNFYICTNDAMVTANFYADIFIANIGALINANWSFAEGELENAKRAQKVFNKMGYMKNPFLMYLPRPPVLRKHRKNVVIRLFESVYGFGFYPYQIMSFEETDRFLSRPASVLPVAEQFLSVVGDDIPVPWAYSIFDVHPIVYPLYNLNERPFFYFVHYLRKLCQRAMTSTE